MTMDIVRTSNVLVCIRHASTNRVVMAGFPPAPVACAELALERIDWTVETTVRTEHCERAVLFDYCQPCLLCLSLLAASLRAFHALRHCVGGILIVGLVHATIRALPVLHLATFQGRFSVVWSGV